MTKILFESGDNFFDASKGAGRTLSVLSACSNKLAQVLSGKKSDLSRFSDKTQETIRNLQKVLKERDADRKRK
jgi:gas vesicle protein